MATEAGYGDFGIGRADRIAKHAGDAARAVASGITGDIPPNHVAGEIANAVAAAARVVADIADDAARDAGALSKTHDVNRVLVRIASDASDAKVAAESVADAAREAVNEAAKADIATNMVIISPYGNLGVKVSEHISESTFYASADTVEDSCSAAAFAARIAYDAAYAVAHAAETADCAARVTSASQSPSHDGPPSGATAAAAADAIADNVDPSTASVRNSILLRSRTQKDILQTLNRPPRAPNVADAVRQAADTTRLVDASIHRARAFAIRLKRDCMEAIELYD